MSLVRTRLLKELCVELLDNMYDIKHLAEEYSWMICKTNAGNISGVFEISHGNIDTSIMGVREIMQKALISGAARIVVSHCHPSGNPKPSIQDFKSTKRIYDAGQLIGIPLDDHIIIGCNENLDFYSFYKERIMEYW